MGREWVLALDQGWRLSLQGRCKPDVAEQMREQDWDRWPGPWLYL